MGSQGSTESRPTVLSPAKTRSAYYETTRIPQILSGSERGRFDLRVENFSRGAKRKSSARVLRAAPLSSAPRPETKAFRRFLSRGFHTRDEPCGHRAGRRFQRRLRTGQ